MLMIAPKQGVLGTVTAVLALLSSTIKVSGHGYLSSPRSRNFYAAQDGTDEGKVGVPKKDYCPHCLNVNYAACGYTTTSDYDNYKDSEGIPMPWISQGTYIEGEVITVKSYLDTHHNGHMVISACAKGQTPEWPPADSTCFNNPDNYLTFDSDPKYDMPADRVHPERGYYFGGESHGRGDFEMKFKLPAGVFGSQVLLQWKYITANSCKPPGYTEYFAGRNSQNKKLPDSYWKKSVVGCTPPYPNDGARGTSLPERFYNCAEVTIKSAAPSRSPKPSLPQPTGAPVAPNIRPTKAPVSSAGCCSQNFQDCITWCGTTKSECDVCLDAFWIPGPQAGCNARWQGCTSDEWSCCSGLTCVSRDESYAQCKYVEAPLTSSPTGTPTKSSKPTTKQTKNPTGPTKPTQSPVKSPTKAPGVGCCSRDFKNCNDTLVGWCSELPKNCIGSCGKFWLPNGAITGCIARYLEGCTSDADCCCPGKCNADGQCMYTGENSVIKCTPGGPKPSTPSPSPPPLKTPTAPPVTVTTNPTPASPKTKQPTFNGSNMSCSSGAGKSSWEALVAMEKITKTVSAKPYTLSVLSEGGAAGDGSFVVSESQAYGVLSSALALVSMDRSGNKYREAKSKFFGYFNGWAMMCKNSKDDTRSCQSTQYCNGGKWPCLPGWKQRGDLSEEVGTGSAADGDEDAIAGMIIATLVVKDDSVKPDWYDKVRDWADRSSTAFLHYNTALSATKSHRILKLGSCWGGWSSEGNNPSYHGPGHFRLMRDFQMSYGARSYDLPDFGDDKPLEEKWNMLIATSYAFLETTQCPQTGLVPNWARVKEANSLTLEKEDGSFSGSGTPQYEFGAEASRTVWRIAFDSAVYPGIPENKAGSFLAPLHNMMVNNFNKSPMNGWEYFGGGTLQACSPDPGYVMSVFGSWHWNQFISAPVYSTLASKVSESLFQGKEFIQQDMIDAACDLVKTTADLSYYPLSWQVIAIMTLNGELAKIGNLVRGNGPSSSPMKSSTPTQTPLGDPTDIPTKSSPIGSTASPTKNPTIHQTKSPTSSLGCCSQNFKDCVSWCGTTKLECLSCGKEKNVAWINGPKTGCLARHDDCTSEVNSCCNGLTCIGDKYYKQCIYVQTPNPTENPSSFPTAVVPTTIAPTALEDPCVNLKRKQCTEKCVFNKKKKIKGCRPKLEKHKYDCSQHTKKFFCKGVDNDVCKFANGKCFHRCAGLAKKKCKEEKVCKPAKIVNPCHGCQLVTTCG